MLKHSLTNNKSVTPSSDFLATLKNDFPGFFDKDGAFDIKKFEQELKQNDVNEAKTGHSLNFVGKDWAKLKYGLAPETVLKPDIKHNNKPENKNSENVFITGDNLEVLKHLRNAYSNKIKIIYIDPPYNTEKKFVYNDKFEFKDEELKSALGYTEEEVSRLKSLQGKSSHSAWLTFMYPRLKIAQKLLKEEGVIFISIDDNELANLKLLCDDIFSERNFVGQWNWVKSDTPPNLSKKIKKKVEYILCYQGSNNNDRFKGIQKNSSSTDPMVKPKNPIKTLIFPKNSLSVKLKDGVYKSGVYGTKKYPNELLSDLIIKNGTNQNEAVFKNKFVWTQPYLDNELANRTRISLSADMVLSYKKAEYSEEVPPNLIDETVKVDTTELAGANLTKLFEFGEKVVFDFPKAVSLLKYLIDFLDDKDCLVLDFFAGSGTTAHAVMQLNADDSGNRKFIMVQSDEPTEEDHDARKAGYNTIDEISRERIKRAAANIKQTINSETLDLGFKHYICQEPATETIEKIDNFDPSKDIQGNFFDDMVKKFGLETILQTWLIADGYDFTKSPEIKNIKGYNAYYIDSSLYIIEKGWGNKQTKELLNLVGTNKLTLNHVRIYGYSLDMESLRELKINVSQSLKNVEIELRY